MRSARFPPPSGHGCIARAQRCRARRRDRGVGEQARTARRDDCAARGAGHAWSGIEARLDALADGTGNVVGIERRLRRWRAGAMAASAIAATLALFVGVRELAPPSPDKMLVAVLQKDAQSPAFLVSVDLEKRQLTIRAVAAKPERARAMSCGSCMTS